MEFKEGKLNLKKEFPGFKGKLKGKKIQVSGKIGSLTEIKGDPKSFSSEEIVKVIKEDLVLCLLRKLYG